MASRRLNPVTRGAAQGRLAGKTALITGGADGIGKAIALRFAQEGAKVAVTDIGDVLGKQVVRAIIDAGGEARYWHMDVSREAQVRRTVERVIAAWSRIDILVNNAGIMGINKPTHEIREREWDRVMAVNVKGVFFCTSAVVPHMIRTGGGSIVNICAAYGTVGAPNTPPYHASKGAVRMMTKTDALLYAADNIRVNSIHPSFIETAMLDEFLDSIDGTDAPQELAALHPLGRIGLPDDVAWGTVYLASDESAFVTGSELVVDGGYTAR